MTGPELGRDRREPDRKLLDRRLAKGLRQQGGEPAPADQSRARKADVEIAEHPARRKAAGPFLEQIKPLGRVAPADDGSDRRAADDVGLEAFGDQGADHPDMREPARGTPTERQGDGGAGRRRHVTVGDCGAIRVAAETLEEIQQRRVLLTDDL